MGVKGAALATIISQALSCIWVLTFLHVWYTRSPYGRLSWYFRLPLPEYLLRMPHSSTLLPRHFVSIVRKFILLLPLIYLMPQFISNKTMGVYLAEPVADVIAVTFTAILFAVQFKKSLKSLWLCQSGNNTSTPGDKMSGNEPTVTIKKYSGQIFADTKAPAAEISIQENKWSS